MARISNFNEARQWLTDWLCEAEDGSEWAKRYIREEAQAQRANVEVVKRRGHSGWCDVGEYERAVVMIEAAAARLN